jgi:hypothetical protein
VRRLCLLALMQGRRRLMAFRSIAVVLVRSSACGKGSFILRARAHGRRTAQPEKLATSVCVK